MLIVVDLVQLAFRHSSQKTKITVIWIIFRFVEIKFNKKSTELATKQHDDMVKEHAILEKVSNNI